MSGQIDPKGKETLFSAMTYNILFPSHNKLQRYLMDFQARYRYQIDEILPKWDADIIVLNEVTQLYDALLRSSKYIRDEFQMTSVAKTHGVNTMILSRIPFTELITLKRYVFILITLQWNIDLSENFDEVQQDPSSRATAKEINFIVIGAHFSSKEHNEIDRAEEITNISEIINILPQFTANSIDREKVEDALNHNNILMLGDFNFHHPCENRNLENLKFDDLWLERHSHFSGITWDPSTNSLINVIYPFDDRKMRLDRICLRPSTQVDLKEIMLAADRPMGKSFLYPSDHYALKATFAISKWGLKARMTKHKVEFQNLPQNSTGFRSIGMIVCYRALSVVSAVVWATVLFLLLILLLWRVWD